MRKSMARARSDKVEDMIANWNEACVARDWSSCQWPGRSNETGKGKHTVSTGKPRTKTISDSLKDTVSVLWLPFSVVQLNEVHLEATSDHTQDGEHTAPAPFKSCQGDFLDWPWVSLRLHSGLSIIAVDRTAMKRCVLTVEHDNNSRKKNTLNEKNLWALSNWLARYSIRPWRWYLPSVLASCFT